MNWEQQAPSPIRILLVEDHELTREGLTALLNGQADVEVVGGVATTAAAVDQVTAQVPDIAVIDVQLPDGNGIALCRRIRAISPTTQCIIHTSVEIGPETATAAGASAVVLKRLSGNQLLDTIRKIAGSDH